MSDTEAQSVVVVSQHFPPDKSGNASRVHDTARHLVDEGWDVTVLAPPPAFPHGQFDRTWTRKQSTTEDGISVQRLWAWQPAGEDPSFLSRMAYYLLFPLHAFLWLLVHYRDVDVIMTSSPPIFTGIAGLPFGLLSGKAWVVDVRDLWIDASVGLGFIKEGGLSERLARRYQRIVLQTADRVTVTTAVLGSELSTMYGISEEKITHLPNGVDTSRFVPSDPNLNNEFVYSEDAVTEQETKQKVSTHLGGGTSTQSVPEDSNQESTKGGSDSTHKIVYTGNVGHAQDLANCIHAMARLNRDDVTLKIVGDGDIKSDLEHLVHEENLEDRVEFTGLVPRDDIPEILDEATIGIAPLKSDETLEYAVPTKAYEYMAFELPVVATGIGELESLIEQSGGGSHVKNDPDAIAEAFESLLEDAEMRTELGTNGREHMIEYYDRGVVAGRLSRTLDEVSAA